MDMMPEKPRTLRPEDSAKVIRVLSDDGTLDPRHDPGLSDPEVIDIYRWMVTTRQLDERLVALQRQGRIGFHVGSLGEEAAIIGSAFAMRKADWLFPCYREFGAALMRGLPLQTFVDNMFGNANDTVQGRQMPDHYTCREVGWASISSPVGTQITQAVGFSWGAKIDGKDLASLVYFGDGATSSTDFHSGMNFAGVFKVPTVFFCRNNGWAISVPVERQTATRTFAEKAAAYGIPGVRVDGNDLFAVVSVVREAVRRGSQGLGPTLIEAITYRMGGHSTSDDPNRYRATEQLKPWAERDPLERGRHYLERRKLWDDRKEQALIAEIDQKFRAAVAVSEKTPMPPLESMFEDVYEKLPWHLQEERAELLRGPRAPSPHS
ncbi:MAG TPA: pyruvate dehydrogenase (acetyl-transferring) E1 component subunit alpha [Polyangiaceae bacterium]|jgi:2-oxoisovalerate dehydrogenase E1 component alpha subunit|nr:pyruvate dehydrogenase (acetyl-transferring) E1 component subunit alpha [Polyangiaceae bacterium]